MSRRADDRQAVDAYTAEHRKIARAFGANVQLLREADGRSQASLASVARLHRTQISFMERGLGAPGLLTILILADALRVTPDVLLECLPVPKERKPYRDIHRDERDPLAWMSPAVAPPPESD
jgi:transcriptional regulator with XRE-family HTH domain